MLAMLSVFTVVGTMGGHNHSGRLAMHSIASRMRAMWLHHGLLHHGLLHAWLHHWLHPWLHHWLHTWLHHWLHAGLHHWLHSGLHHWLHTWLHHWLHPWLHHWLHTGLHHWLHSRLHHWLHAGLHHWLHAWLHHRLLLGGTVSSCTAMSTALTCGLPNRLEMNLASRLAFVLNLKPVIDTVIDTEGGKFDGGLTNFII